MLQYIVLAAVFSAFFHAIASIWAPPKTKTWQVILFASTGTVLGLVLTTQHFN